MPAAVFLDDKTLMDPHHLQNLVGLAKELGLHGKALRKITPNDILINPMGGVQLINPEQIVTLKTGSKGNRANAALRISEESVDAFVEEHTLIPRGAARDYTPLKNQAAARRAPLHAAFRADRKEAMGTRANINDVLNEAVNAGPERDFIRGLLAGERADPDALAEFARANGIEQQFVRMGQQLSKGLLPDVDPVVLSIGPEGALYIRDGFDRLVAAKMLGADFVPINFKKFLGEVPSKRQFYTGPSFKISQVFDADDAPGISGLSGIHGEVGSLNYKIVGPQGNFLNLSREGITSVGKAEGADLLGSTTSFSAIGLAGGEEALQTRRVLTGNALRNSVGEFEDVSLAVAHAAETSKDYKEFAGLLRQMTKNPRSGRVINMKNLDSPAVAAEAEQVFETLVRPKAAKFLDELARAGYLTDSGVANPARRAVALKSTGGTLVDLQRDRGILSFENPQKTTQELDELAKNMLNARANAADIDPFTRIILKGSDQILEKEVGDFVTSPHPRLRDSVIPTTQFKISPQDLKAWRTEHGIIKVASKMPDQDIKDLGLKAGGRLLDSDNRSIPFFITRSGDMFLSTKHRDVPGMLEAAFGRRGPVFAVETGVFHSGGIAVDGLLGMQGIEKLGAAEINRLKGRMQHIANQFLRMGVNEKVLLRFSTPFEKAAWENIYGQKVPLQRVANPGFKMKIPEQIKDMPLDRAIQVENRIVTVRRRRFKNPQQQAMFEFVQKNFDDAYLREFEAGLSDNYHQGYFHRALTPETQEAMNEVFMNLTKEKVPGGARTLRALQSFMKQRVFTDLTTRDVNNMFESIKDLVKGEWESPEQMVNKVILSIKKDYKLTLNPDTAKRYIDIAEAMPSGHLFFITDPLTALSVRHIQSESALKSKGIVDTLASAGAILRAPADEYKQLIQGRETVVGKQQTLINNMKGELDQLTSRLDDLKNKSPDVASEEITKLEKSIVEQEAKINHEKIGLYDLQEQFVDRYGSLAFRVDPTSRTVFIDANSADKLVKKGAIDITDVQTGADNALVEIPFERYSAQLTDSKTDVLLFTPESRALADKYFSTQKRDGFHALLRGLDTMNRPWKLNILFPIPAYHGRNVLSNGFQMWLGGTLKARNVEDSFNILRVLEKKRGGVISIDEANDILDNMMFGNEIGGTATGRQLLNEFHRRGGFSGAYANEFSNFGTVKRRTDFERLTKNMGGIPSVSEGGIGALVSENVLVRGGLKVGNWYESRSRLATFMDEWRKTGNFEAAEMKVKGVHYDYRDLTAFERDVLTPLIPFYAWSRFNIPKMMQTMVQEPIQHARFLRMVHQIEQGAFDRAPKNPDDYPGWMQESFGFTIFKRKEDGNFLVRFGEGLFPLIDGYKFVEGGGMKMIKNGITPFLKFPIEQIMNKSLFTGRDIERFPGEPSRDFTLSRLGFSKTATTKGPLGIANIVMNDAALGNFFRLGKVAADTLNNIIDPKQWIGGDPSVSLVLWDLMLGRGKFVDPEATRAIAKFNWRTSRNKIMSALRHYEKTGNTWMTNEVRKLLLKHDLENGVPEGK